MQTCHMRMCSAVSRCVYAWNGVNWNKRLKTEMLIHTLLLRKFLLAAIFFLKCDDTSGERLKNNSHLVPWMAWMALKHV